MQELGEAEWQRLGLLSLFFSFLLLVFAHLSLMKAEVMGKGVLPSRFAFSPKIDTGLISVRFALTIGTSPSLFNGFRKVDLSNGCFEDA